jgi:chromatin segregation and condensation protein Rec8/ScpA/Scc1 (kleisin family)
MRRALDGLLELAHAAVAEEAMVQEKIVTLEVKIQELFSVFKNMKETTFRGLSKGASRAEVIVTFLAILHLAREQIVMIEQAHRDSDIIIRHVELGTA